MLQMSRRRLLRMPKMPHARPKMLLTQYIRLISRHLHQRMKCSSRLLTWRFLPMVCLRARL